MRILIIFNLLVYGIIFYGLVSLINHKHPEAVVQDIPAPVLEVFAKNYPEARVKRYQQNQKDGQRVYEISFTLADKEMEVRYATDGRLLKVEEMITSDSLPDNIRQKIDVFFHPSRITRAARVFKDGQLFYDVKVYFDSGVAPVQRALRFSQDAHLLTKI